MPPQDNNQEEKRIETNRILHQADFPVGVVKQRAVEAKIVFFGIAANRPDGASEVKAWFATDTGVLSMWAGSAWLSTTLS